MPQRATVEWNGEEIKKKVRAAAIQGITLAAEHLLGESRTLVPLEEGTLERSGTVVVDETNLRATVTYDTPYAVRQHEELNYRHAPGRQAKYLETPMATERDTMQAIIAAQIRRALR
ncbi:hypothetical protein GCM10009557_05880 [Virgisporangium ochraceum]|uniref:Phage protein, HK97 gp10 family n=1 Tax=Virgisporangium ochraceum TaxID=65505 RepID=A0A8J3ZRL3_9ACTN|nr:minor capsid protein [Virgisporangium ochraceum]GIJ66245.1 hypothetical protein Voc01_011620 [Virgisporangium ochraceum]